MLHVIPGMERRARRRSIGQQEAKVARKHLTQTAIDVADVDVAAEKDVRAQARYRSEHSGRERRLLDEVGSPPSGDATRDRDGRLRVPSERRHRQPTTIALTGTLDEPDVDVGTPTERLVAFTREGFVSPLNAAEAAAGDQHAQRGLTR